VKQWIGCLIKGCSLHATDSILDAIAASNFSKKDSNRTRGGCTSGLIAGNQSILGTLWSHASVAWMSWKDVGVFMMGMFVVERLQTTWKRSTVIDWSTGQINHIIITILGKHDSSLNAAVTVDLF
jgi:hypothetical protein